MFFVLLSLVLFALDSVQLNTPDFGPGSGTVKFTKDVKLIRKTLPQDGEFFGISPHQNYQNYIRKAVENAAYDNPNVVPNHKTTIEPRRFYEDVVLVIGATSAGVTMMFALFLLCFVIITAFRRRRALIRRQRAQGMEANRAMPQSPPASVPESENLSKIEFTFETEKTHPQKQKLKVTAEKTYTKCQTLPKLPPKQRKRATKRNGSEIWTREDMELSYYHPETDFSDEYVRHYVSPYTRRMVTTRAEVHAPPKE